MTFYSQGSGGHFSGQQENTEQYVPPEQLVPGFVQATPNEETAHYSQPLVQESYEKEPDAGHHPRPQPSGQERDERWGQPAFAAGGQRVAEGSHRSSAHRTVSLTALFTILAVICVGLGVFITEHDRSLWNDIHAWGLVAIVAAAITATPLVAGAVHLDAKRAWQVAAGGAAFLLLYWVLFILPGIGSNTSLLSSAGVAFGVVAAWLAPGRPTEQPVV